jgi:hypothetical protein
MIRAAPAYRVSASPSEEMRMKKMLAAAALLLLGCSWIYGQE